MIIEASIGRSTECYEIVNAMSDIEFELMFSINCTKMRKK